MGKRTFSAAQVDALNYLKWTLALPLAKVRMGWRAAFCAAAGTGRSIQQQYV
jgi:hypothetical protein